MDISLIFPAFIAGLLMFIAPCTLPLLPAYLAFISGVDQKDFQDSKKLKKVRWKVFVNGLFYVIGFSVVFVLLGTLAGFAGTQVLGDFRALFSKVGGIFVILFGLFMLGIIKVKGLSADKKIDVPTAFQKGKPSTSFLLGASFAFGWTPCIGPILGSVLLLASTSTTVWQGAFLLAVFSLGLAIPFLLFAWGIGSAYKTTKVLHRFMPILSKIGGVFLIILGILLFTNNMGLLISYGYEWFEFLNYEGILQYL